jgi:hypothetical protein
MILVDDGSTNDSWNEITDLAKNMTQLLPLL